MIAIRLTHYCIRFEQKLPYGLQIFAPALTFDIVCTNLQGNPFEIAKKVLLSDSKKNYESREACIKEELIESEIHSLHLCLPDPDRLKTDPQNPIFSFI